MSLSTRHTTPHVTPLLILLTITSAHAVAAENAPIAQVHSQRPEQQSLATTITAYGVLQSDPSANLTTSFAQAGQLERILVSVGQKIKKGTVLAVLKTDPQMIMTTTQASSAVVFATGERTRIADLYTAKLATQSQLATAEKALTDAKATLQALQQQGGQNTLQTLRAPADALVISINNQTGERVAAGAPLIVLSKVSTPQAIIGISPEMVSQLHSGMAIKIMPVFMGSGGQSSSMTGSLARTDGVVNSQTGRIDVPVRFTQSLPDTWRAGLPVQATVTLSAAKGWVVPRNTVLQDGQGAYIYQIKNNKAVRTPVKIGTQTNQYTAISGAINPNLNIVTLGNYTLSDGMAVQEQQR
ncbi:efflux RND transporter periplasmic adaptor subunit [Aquirhabdus sp.]|uniref:efflux RND transporter periplasmic adaptor subunit n=1 Tax=Aquirhabdus sp. TaxID=2824160 RepID=UPI00396CB3C7